MRLLAALGTTVTIATLPVNPLIAIGTGALTAAQVIKELGGQFSRLNAQEAAVFGALNETIANLRKTDPKVRDATAAQVEGTIKSRDPGLARAVAKTLEILGSKEIVTPTARDGDVYYAIKF